MCSKRKEKAMAYTDKGKIKARQNRLAEQRLRRQQEEKQRKKRNATAGRKKRAGGRKRQQEEKSGKNAKGRNMNESRKKLQKR